MVIVAVGGAMARVSGRQGPGRDGTDRVWVGRKKVKWYPPSARCTLTLVDEAMGEPLLVSHGLSRCLTDERKNG